MGPILHQIQKLLLKKNVPASSSRMQTRSPSMSLRQCWFGSSPLLPMAAAPEPKKL
mgnify:CR=1 FL=1